MEPKQNIAVVRKTFIASKKTSIHLRFGQKKWKNITAPFMKRDTYMHVKLAVVQSKSSHVVKVETRNVWVAHSQRSHHVRLDQPLPKRRVPVVPKILPTRDRATADERARRQMRMRRNGERGRV
jgi:hypothetical protein